MSKAFSETEIEVIRTKLIESCQKCWERQGYRKTTVAEMATMAGISTGAFYTFYETKELLFIATADYYSNLLLDQFRESLPTHACPQDFADGLKALTRELDHHQWMLSLSADYEIFLRKLPSEFLEENFHKDLLDFTAMIKSVGLVAKISMEDFTAIINALFAPLYFAETMGERYHMALDFIIDSTIPNLLEKE